MFSPSKPSKQPHQPLIVRPCKITEAPDHDGSILGAQKGSLPIGLGRGSASKLLVPDAWQPELNSQSQVVVVCAYNPNSEKTETGGSLWLAGQPVKPLSELQASEEQHPRLILVLSRMWVICRSRCKKQSEL